MLRSIQIFLMNPSNFFNGVGIIVSFFFFVTSHSKKFLSSFDVNVLRSISLKFLYNFLNFFV